MDFTRNDAPAVRLRQGTAGIDSNPTQRASRDDDLASDIANVRAREQRDADDAAIVLAKRLTRAEEQIAQLGRFLDRINQRMGQMETRLKRLSNQSSDQEDALRMMCEVLKGLDDPYGFGQSLDERVFGKETERTSDGEE